MISIERGIGWFLFALFTIIAIVYMFVALFVLRPIDTVTQQSNNNLVANFDAGSGGFQVDNSVNPFNILTATRPNDVKNMVVYTDLGTLSVISLPDQDAIMANVFQTTDFMNVTAFQLFSTLPDPNNANTSRTVALFNYDTRALLVQADVNTATDPVTVGFYTHYLDTVVPLTPFVNYAIVGAYLAGDQYIVQQNVVQPALEVQIISQAIVRGASGIALPNPGVFIPATNSLLYASMQMQKTATVNQTAWGIDLGSDGYPTFPPKYVYDLNVQVQEEETVSIDAGVCINASNDTNMVNLAQLSLSAAQNGVNGLDRGSLDPDTWYAVYLINSTLQHLPAAGLLSLNLQEPFVVPIAYNCFRRVGWARSNVGGTGFVPSTQSGNGSRRNTTYIQPAHVFSHSFTPFGDIQNGVTYIVPLELITPPASSTVVRVVTNNPNASPVNCELGERFFRIPLDVSTVELELVVAPVPIPHETTIRLTLTNVIASDVQVDIYVLSFFDEL